MASNYISPRQVVSTNDLEYGDDLAVYFEEFFIKGVIPNLLILYLPHGFLTEADEELVVARQSMYGATVAARLLLQIMSQRGDWVPPLIQGLRHREIRLEHLADLLENMQAQIRLQIDLDTEEAMEIDDDSPPSPAAYDFSDHELQTVLTAGLQSPEQRQAYTRLVMARIAEHFFTNLCSTPDQVPDLVQHLERIGQMVQIPSFAYGCLELNITPRVDSPSSVDALRRLNEGGALQRALELGLYTEERRVWLQKEASKYGCKFKRLALKVTISEEQLSRCEIYLTVKNECANPQSVTEALLLNFATSGSRMKHSSCCMPQLLLSFLDSMVDEGLDLAQRLAPNLCQEEITDVVRSCMTVCLNYFDVSPENARDLGLVALGILDARGSAVSEDVALKEIAGDQSSEQTAGDQSSEHTAGNQSSEQTVAVRIESVHQLTVQSQPGSHLAKAIQKLETKGFMVPVQGEDHSYAFSSSFITDFALACMVASELQMRTLSSSVRPHSARSGQGLLNEVLRCGSPHIALHLAALVLGHIDLGLDGPDVTLIQQALTTVIVSGKNLQFPALELFLACDLMAKPTVHQHKIYIPLNKISKEIKRVLTSTSTVSQVLSQTEMYLCTEEDYAMVENVVKSVLAARHTVDLTQVLNDVTKAQLQIILTCVQLSNVGVVHLSPSNGETTLKILSRSWKDLPTHSSKTVLPQQPALKLCKNTLSDMHVDCLLQAMCGLESVRHFDLSECTVTVGNLQRLLNSMHMHSVEALKLNDVNLKGGSEKCLLQFSHLKLLHTLELENTRLSDNDMVWLSKELQGLKDLRELSLARNNISTVGLSILTPVLSSFRALHVVRLYNCPLEAGSAFVLGAMLTSARDLHVLNLSNCQLLDSGLQHLALVLKDHVRLTKVALRNTGCSSLVLSTFLSYLSKCKRLQHLELGKCPLADEGGNAGKAFLSVLAGSHMWDYLGLWQCHLGSIPGFMGRLCTLTDQLHGLTDLVLQDNALGDHGTVQLSEAIKRGVFRYLQRLNLCQNQVGKEGALHLASVIKYLPFLKELLMQHSYIPPNGAKELALAALHLPNMELLNLSDSFNIDSPYAKDVLDDVVAAVREGVVIGEGVEFILTEKEKQSLSADGKVGKGVHTEATTDIQEGKEEKAESLLFRQSAEFNLTEFELIVDDKFHITMKYT